MRTAVISDIHGNLEAFLAVLDDIQQQNIDAIISLGDNIGYGADSEKVIQLIRQINIPSVLGNHEMAAINHQVHRWFIGDARAAIDKAISSLSKESLTYIQEMPTTLSMSDLLFVHGFPPDSFRVYLTQVSTSELIETFDVMEENICFVGHTHKLRLVYPRQGDILIDRLAEEQTVLKKNRKYIINAGSVGQPRDGDPRAKYVIWDSEHSELQTRWLKYDRKTAAKKIIQAGIPERFAMILDMNFNQ